MTSISYFHSDEIFRGHKEHLSRLISLIRPARVADIGGGASPALLLEEAAALGVSEYAVIDISASELAKLPDSYQKIRCDICGPEVPIGYDLVISHYLAEHISCPEAFHRNVFRMLNPGGVAFHCFPTMFSLAYVANMLIPESIGQRLVKWVNPAREQSGSQGKFPAFYRWCFGPTKANIRRLRSLGYEVESYCGFFGHYYYAKIRPLHWLHQLKTNALLSHPVPQLTSVASVILRKPAA